MIQAFPFVTTFVNTTNITMNAELHFSDNNIVNKIIDIGQSYEVVNFYNKMITLVRFSSLDKDKNGNLYAQCDQNFMAPTEDLAYTIALQKVPAHKIPAADGTDAFQMPDSEKIICNAVRVKAKDVKKN
jgi:hypothetical protein